MPTVSIKGHTTTYQAQDKEIIFDALERQGVELPHGCLAGSCGACRIEVHEGCENLSEPGPIEANTLEAIKVNYERIHGLRTWYNVWA